MFLARLLVMLALREAFSMQITTRSQLNATQGRWCALGEHQRTCSVCRHGEQREEIEGAFIGWRSPAAIAEEFGLANRASVYRHAQRAGTQREAKEEHLERRWSTSSKKAGEVDVTASAVVACAVQAYAKINAAGEWIDRTETVSLNDLFERMSTEELESYAQSGALPGWFKATAGVSG